jgi:excisionase family DNA binding protein
MGQKAILTTWEAGRYCNVSPYTVRYWVRTGQLQAYTTPGGHRRIRRQDLDAFLVSHGMPLPSGFHEGRKRVLILGAGAGPLAQHMESWSEALEVQVAPSAFDAGLMLVTFDPHLFLVDLDASAWDGLAICRTVHSTSKTAHIQLVGLVRKATVEEAEAAQRAGILSCFAKPVDGAELRRFLRKLFPYSPWVPATR